MAAVVIMACNRADYLERTINSVLKYVSLQPIFFTLLLFYTLLFNNLLFVFFRYQRPISSRFPLFVSQVFIMCTLLGVQFLGIYGLSFKCFTNTYAYANTSNS